MAASTPASVSLSAGANATRRAARGSEAACADVRELICSLGAPQRRVLAHALAAGVDIAALLSECEQPTGETQRMSNMSQPTKLKTAAATTSAISAANPSGVRAEASMVGRRVEYCFVVNRRRCWFGGQVLRDAGGSWADVLFDDDEKLCVRLLPSTDGTAWRWSPPPTQVVQQREKTVDTTIGPIKLGAQVWVKWIEGDGKFYPAHVTNVSQISGVTVRYPDTAEWDSMTEVLPILEITPERVHLFNPEAHRASSADSSAADPDGSGLGRPGTSGQPVSNSKKHPRQAAAGEERGVGKRRRQNATGSATGSPFCALTTTSSTFVGVSWAKKESMWNAYISHENKRVDLGRFHDEVEAARAFDAAARRLRGDNAHGGAVGKAVGFRLNFPTKYEVEKAREAKASRQADADKAMADQRKSKYVGVYWARTHRKWRVSIRHSGALSRVVQSSTGRTETLGAFDDEREAAAAYDRKARQLRGNAAHGGLQGLGIQWSRLNFPTDKEVRRAHAAGMPADLNLQL